MRILSRNEHCHAHLVAARGPWEFSCLCGATEMVAGDPSVSDLLSRGMVFCSAHQACKRLVTDRAPEARERTA